MITTFIDEAIFVNSLSLNQTIVDFDTAIQVNPNYAIAYYNRGIAHSELGDPNRAIVDFDKAIELDPDDPHALDQRGVAYFELSDYGRAIADYDAALRLDPEPQRARKRAQARSLQTEIHYESEHTSVL